jgi:hypothetical protein
MNTTALMVMGAPQDTREELKKAYVKGEAGADLCVGGCKEWKDTEAGRERYQKLGDLMRKHKEKAC